MPSTINANNTTGLVSTADTSGVLQLQTNGTTAVTVDDSQVVTFAKQPAGTFAGTGPAFSAYANTTQAITANTWTKVNFANERFDTNSNFASSRFTPTVAGYYLLSSNVYFDSNPSGQTILNLSINGTGSGGYGLNRFVTTGASQLSGSMVVYLNGSTDYAEIYFYSTGANTLNSGTSDTLVLFTGAMIRSA
jgi:hypothetical protein